MVHLLRCVLVLAMVVCCVGETVDEKTTEVVATAVARAANTNQVEEQKEAKAVADATLGVIESESTGNAKVAPDVVTKARDAAEQTFEQLRDANAGTKVAADAAAKVAIAEVDGAPGLHVAEVVKENAEKAAVASADGLAEHPGNEAKAVSEALVTIQKEEQTPGAADLKEKSMLAKAEDAVSDLPSKTSEAVEDTASSVGHVVSSPAVAAPFVLIVFAAIFLKAFTLHAQPSEYMKRIMSIRHEIDVEEGRAVPLPEVDCERMYAALG